MKRTLITLTALALLAAAYSTAEAALRAKITIQGISVLQANADSTDPYTRNIATSGLADVAAGDYLYFKANEGDTTIRRYTWTLTRPNNDAETELLNGDQQVTRLRTKVTGFYTVSLVVANDTAQSDPVSIKINSANWVGAGAFNGDPVGAQCASCHNGGVDDKVTTWKETKHASMFSEGINGHKEGTHYGPNCVRCHTVGYNTDSLSVNNGFDDVARAEGWTFLDSAHGGYRDSTWAEMKRNFPRTSNMANIQCENCHGPGSRHGGNTNDNRIATSLDVGNCNVCHDASSHHYKGTMWRNSLHSHPTTIATGTGRNVCVRCHTAAGFVEQLAGVPDSLKTLAYMPITCAACHDPHDATNEYQLRTIAPVTLTNGVQVDYGTGNLCANCHHSRNNAAPFVEGNRTGVRLDPHHGPQADMLKGTNAIEFGRRIGSNTRHRTIEDGCVHCHMQPDTMSMANPDWASAGNHTFSMTMKSGADYTTACNTCHDHVESFDEFEAGGDYDRDGSVETVPAEINGMLAQIRDMLPHNGEVIRSDSTFTLTMKQATYNYNFVREDKSNGMHNTQYAVGILQAAIDTLTRVSVPITDAPTPMNYSISEAYPNPFNPISAFNYSLPHNGAVDIKLFDMVGRELATVVSGEHKAGTYKAFVNLAGRPSGMYILRMNAGAFTESKKLVLVK